LKFAMKGKGFLRVTRCENAKGIHPRKKKSRGRGGSLDVNTKPSETREKRTKGGDSFSLAKRAIADSNIPEALTN